MLSSLRTPKSALHSQHVFLSPRIICSVPRALGGIRRYSPTNQTLGLSVPSERRENPIGVQQLPAYVRSQLFLTDPPEPDSELVELAQKHLQHHGLFGKTSDSTPPISFDLPKLQGKSLDEHFYKLGREASEPYLEYAKEFAKATLPSKPTKWTKQSGWTKYCEGKEPEKVPYPDENMLVFDVEVLYKESPFAVMACAASPTAWYAWLSPWILQERESPRQLIPLGNLDQGRIVVGHNIGYDRARIADEYDVKQTNNAFLDTMSLHVAVNGMCSQQRPTWMKHAKNRAMREKLGGETDNPELLDLLENAEEEEPWVSRSSINSLRDVAKFHCQKTVDKSVRDEFGTLNKTGVLEKFDLLLDYCADDVAISHDVFSKVLPNFLDVCPHPVSFAALRHLSSVILPVNKSWETYIQNAEGKYQELLAEVFGRLVGLCNSALQLRDQVTSKEGPAMEGDRVIECKPKPYETDPWLNQLDWSGQAIRYKKVTKKNPAPVPAANQKMPGMPKWYKDLFPKASGPMNLSVRTRIAPLLLRMCWDGQPLIWSNKYGWCFRVNPEDAEKYEDTPVVRVDMQSEEKNLRLRDDTDHTYFKIPHKDGPLARCINPLAKGYLQHFESGMLSSEYPLAKEALEMNAMCSYWISVRERVKSQMVVYQSDLKQQDADSTETPPEASMTSAEELLELGFILPQIIPMGTITRRAVERTWLTASNAKKNRVGSELKAMVTAPPGYVFVGADVDSEELWIASLVGDAQFKLHGGGALGFMTLEGTKSAGTDLHSKTAEILRISRGSAKVFNYGRIYGAGVKFASTLLRQFNPRLSDETALETAHNLYHETKGVKTKHRLLPSLPFWRGGTESLVFNKLEEFAQQEQPRTPVLGASITEALQQRFITKGGFLTSRINWAIQSSGVDYLHLLVVSMNYLVRLYGLDARLVITVHDEIRYLVKEEHKYKAAMAMQVANVWTRAMFAQQMGIEDLPQSCAWFSAVDIDTVLRKEVDLDCVTPSHPNPIPKGESIDIQTLLTKDPEAILDESEGTPIDLSAYKYVMRPRVMETLGKRHDQKMKMWLLRAQIATDEELKEITNEIASEASATKAAAKLRKEAKLKETEGLSYPKGSEGTEIGEHKSPWWSKRETPRKFNPYSPQVKW